MLDAYGLTKCVEAVSGLEYSPKSYQHRGHYTIHRTWILHTIYAGTCKHYKNLPIGDDWTKGLIGSYAPDKAMYWMNCEVSGTRKDHVDKQLNRELYVFGKLVVRLLAPIQATHSGRKVKSSKHRVHVQCPCCKTWVVFGRFGQHYKTKTCLNYHKKEA